MDHLSNLPDAFLLHIFSFLPAKDAIKTSLIARRFRHLWKFLGTLSFDFCPYHNCETKTYADGPEYNENFLLFVYNLLLLHQGNAIHTFHLKLELDFSHTMNACLCENFNHEAFVVKEKKMADAVTTWIHFVIRKKVQVLHLDFLGCGVGEASASYILPSVVFSEDEYLKELKLTACEIKRIARVQLRSLKKLLLSQVVLDDNIMDQILSGCHVLEEMRVLDCYGLSRLGFRNPSIKSLEVTIWHKIRRLEICCPNIVSLDLCGRIEHVDLVDVSSVASASMTCYNLSQCEISACLKVKTLFKKLRHCKNFRTCPWSVLVFNKLHIADLSFQWRYLELKLVQKQWHHPGISYLLRCSPLLETLDVYIRPKWDDVGEFDETHLLQAQNLDKGELWSSQAGTFHCLEYHLKTARIYGDVTEPHVIEFIEFLLKNAMVLEKLVISTKMTFQPTRKRRFYSRPIAHIRGAPSLLKTLEVCQRLFSSPRASGRARILFS